MSEHDQDPRDRLTQAGFMELGGDSWSKRDGEVMGVFSTEQALALLADLPEETRDRRVRRVLHEGDPRGDDYREAQEWIREIRSRISHIRGELEDVARIEARFPHDSLCKKVAGTLTLTLIALHGLVEGERSFAARAEQVDALWKEVAADPDAFVIEPGGDWDWRPSGIFKRGGPT